MNLNPRIILKPSFTVVGLSCQVPGVNGSTEALWELLGERYHEISQADPDVGYGVHTWDETGRQYLAGLGLRGMPGSWHTPSGMATLVSTVAKAPGISIGLLNIAEELDGLQIGLINIARNKESFSVLPFINYSR